MTTKRPYGLLAALALCACVVGCDRASEEARAPARPSAPAPAATNVAAPSAEERHVAEMRQAVAERQDKGKALARVEMGLREQEARARAALPAGATPEQVRTELKANPQKYPAYRELAREQAKLRAEANDFSKAREMIRARHAQRKAAEDRAQGAAAAQN